MMNCKYRNWKEELWSYLLKTYQKRNSKFSSDSENICTDSDGNISQHFCFLYFQTFCHFDVFTNDGITHEINSFPCQVSLLYQKTARFSRYILIIFKDFQKLSHINECVSKCSELSEDLNAYDRNLGSSVESSRFLSMIFWYFFLYKVRFITFHKTHVLP